MIDRGKVIKESEKAIDILSKIDEPTFYVDFVRCAFEDAIDLLKQEAIVRCKDCQNGAYVAAPGMLPFVKCGGIDHELDWFCADGKRR